MLNTLFQTENIKYVVSVDDCFIAPDSEQLRNELFIDSLTSFETVKPHFIKYGKENEVKEIQDMLDVSIDASVLIQSLIDGLNDEEVKECFNTLHQEKESLSVEKENILEFLEKLKTDGIIEKYVTIPSTHDAENFDATAQGMNDGAILWLIDKSFTNANESDNAGIELAKNKVCGNDNFNNYVFILTAIELSSGNEELTEKEFDEILSNNGAEKNSFIYYIRKKLVIDKKLDKIAKSLAYGFKRRQCYILMDVYTNCLRESCDTTIKELHNIDQKTLNYVFGVKVHERGESYFDFFNRLVQIFHEDEYGKLLSKNSLQIYENINHYRELCEKIPENIGDLVKLEDSLLLVRKKELYDTHINQKNSEVSTGDIFKINEEYYILVTQSCDTYLRSDGKRKLDKAILLKIVDSPDTCYKFELSCFCVDDFFKHPAVIFHNNCILPFEILDLCVTDTEGRAMIDVSYFDEDYSLKPCFTSNYLIRHKDITVLFCTIYKNMKTVDDFLQNFKKVDHGDNLKDAISVLSSCDAFLKNYKIEDTTMSFPVQRVARLNEISTIDLLREYGNVLSRIGHPFDFLKKQKKDAIK